MITTEQFEHKLIEYLDGELSDAEKREVEEYLQAHPEAIELKGDFSLLCAAGKSIRESAFPADLLLEANRKLVARLADSRRENVAPISVASSNGSPETVPNRTLLSNRRRRLRPPVLAAVLAALAILTVGAVTQRAALADIASSLLQRVVVTFNDEPLSDSQQQTFDELVEITETLDENGDPVVTVNMDGDQLFQEFRDGVLEVMVSGDENNEAVSSNLVDSPLLTELGAEKAIIVVGPPGAHTAFEISLDEKPIIELDVLSPHAHDSLHTALDLLPAAKIGSQSPGVAEGKSWGDIKRAAGSTTDDSP